MNSKIDRIGTQWQNWDTQKTLFYSNQPEISLMCVILNPTIKGIEYV